MRIDAAYIADFQKRAQAVFLQTLKGTADLSELSMFADIVRGKDKKIEYHFALPRTGMREWKKERVPHTLSFKQRDIEKADYEDTILIERDDLIFDQFNIVRPQFVGMAERFNENLRDIVCALFAGGFTGTCWTGSTFFGTHTLTTSDGLSMSFANETTAVLAEASLITAFDWFGSLTDITGRPLKLNRRKKHLFVSQKNRATAHALLDLPNKLSGAGAPNPCYGLCTWSVLDELSNSTDENKWFLGIVDTVEKPFIGMVVDSNALNVNTVGLPRWIQGHIPGEDQKEGWFGCDCMQGADYGYPWLMYGSDGTV